MAAAPSFNPGSEARPRAGRNHIAAGAKPRARDGRLLRLIAVFKFLKSASLVALAAGVFRMMHQDIGMRLEQWVRAMHLDPGNRHVAMFLMRASNLTPLQIKKLGLVGLLYAGLFLIEGTGLWLQRRWGEWVTVVITGMLIPVEMYEIVPHPNVVKVLVLLLNVAVVWYLISRIRASDRSSG